MVSARTFEAIGTRCKVLAESEAAVEQVLAIAVDRVQALDQAASRFRTDSELSSLPRGSWQPISPVLAEVLAAALRTARLTDGLVDPTVGQAVTALGYDTDFEAVRSRRPAQPPARRQVVPGAHRILLDRDGRQVLIPHHITVDVGASAKAWAADWIARACARQLDAGVLVNLGGDLAIAGPAPVAGWRIAIDDGTTPPDGQPVVTLRSGGMATSSTRRRAWRSGERRVHHIIDPRTGDSATDVWQAATVTAASCELANAASTAAVVLGTEAPQWLARRGLPARLMSARGIPVFVGSWPDDQTHLKRRSA
jgi:thiamine biosynthesis lipoprotein